MSSCIRSPISCSREQSMQRTSGLPYRALGNDQCAPTAVGSAPSLSLSPPPAQKASLLSFIFRLPLYTSITSRISTPLPCPAYPPPHCPAGRFKPNRCAYQRLLRPRTHPKSFCIKDPIQMPDTPLDAPPPYSLVPPPSRAQTRATLTHPSRATSTSSSSTRPSSGPGPGSRRRYALRSQRLSIASSSTSSLSSFLASRPGLARLDPLMPPVHAHTSASALRSDYDDDDDGEDTEHEYGPDGGKHYAEPMTVHSTSRPSSTRLGLRARLYSLASSHPPDDRGGRTHHLRGISTGQGTSCMGETSTDGESEPVC
jgi:hypothetical protein